MGNLDLGGPPRPVIIFGSAPIRIAREIAGKHLKNSLSGCACSRCQILLLKMSVEILFIFRSGVKLLLRDVLTLRGLRCFQMNKSCRTTVCYLSVVNAEEGGCQIVILGVLGLYKDKSAGAH